MDEKDYAYDVRHEIEGLWNALRAICVVLIDSYHGNLRCSKCDQRNDCAYLDKVDSLFMQADAIAEAEGESMNKGN